MTRRLAIGLSLVAALGGAGCTTFSDNDAVARVGDEELSADELAELIVGADGGDTPVDADLARQQIGSWIGERLPSEADAGQAPELYADGLLASGTLCSLALVTDVEADRDAAVAELENGDDWSTVFAQYNVNPNLAETAGSLGCGGIQDYASTGIFELFSGLTATEPVGSQTIDDNPELPFYVVAQFVPYDDLSPDETAAVIEALPPDLSGVDIYVDPRYGSFDPAAGVVPLG